MTANSRAFSNELHLSADEKDEALPKRQKTFIRKSRPEHVYFVSDVFNE